MIHETTIDQAINTLQSHFGKRLIVRPPASATELAELESMAGTLPRDLVIFLSTCNGLRVQIDERYADEHLASIHEIEMMMRAPGSPAALGGMLPLRGDPERLCDWLIVETGPLYGRVIRWGAWSPQVLVLASGFGAYVSAWCAYMFECFDRHGKERLDRATPDFDADFIRKWDPEPARLNDDPAVGQWIRGFVALLPSGSDFE